MPLRHSDSTKMRTAESVRLTYCPPAPLARKVSTRRSSGRTSKMCMPGDNVVMEISLITPIAIEEGLRFAIREGGRTVGSGVVTEKEKSQSVFYVSLNQGENMDYIKVLYSLALSFLGSVGFGMIFEVRKNRLLCVGIGGIIC